MSEPGSISRGGGLLPSPGADYERVLEERRERERARKRDARKRQTPEQRERERARKRDERLRSTPEQREREKKRERTRSRKKIRPFMAIDGEGGGTDDLGRQNYLLMVASGSRPGDERILHREGKS